MGIKLTWGWHWKIKSTATIEIQIKPQKKIQFELRFPPYSVMYAGYTWQRETSGGNK